MGDHQDWTPVVIRGNPKIGSKTKEQKYSQNAEAQRLNKLDQNLEDDTVKNKFVPTSYGRQIQQARSKMVPAWDQKTLAQRLNIPKDVIQKIETGKAIYNPQILEKIKRILKITKFE